MAKVFEQVFQYKFAMNSMSVPLGLSRYRSTRLLVSFVFGSGSMSHRA
jgi:hypothetical protein